MASGETDAGARRRARVPGRHHDDHFPGGLLRDQVVQDEAGAPGRGPRVVAVAGAVQEIQHRVLAAARLVAGRRVDVHPPEHAERRGVVGHFGDRAARHRFRVEQLRAGHVDEAPRVVVGLAGGRVARVERLHAVHVERVAVGAGGDRSERDLPDAVLAFRHRRPGAERHAGSVAGVEPHGVGLRRVQADGDAAIVRNLRRDHHRRGRTTAARLRGRGRRRQKGGDQQGRDADPRSSHRAVPLSVA